MNKYKELKEKHQRDVNNFPMMFAFSNKQFAEGMKKLGLEETDTDKIYSFTGTGGYYKKTDAPKLHKMFDRHEAERQEAIAGDKTGEGYIYEMFDYELGNREYCITYDIMPTLDALGLTVEEVNADERMTAAIKRATNEQTEWYAMNG